MSEQTQPQQQDLVKQAPKLVKIRTLREIAINNNIIPKNEVIEVTEDLAKEFCDKQFDGYSPFYGTKPEIGPLMNGTGLQDMNGNPVADPLVRQKIVRAVRVA